MKNLISLEYAFALYRHRGQQFPVLSSAIGSLGHFITLGSEQKILAGLSEFLSEVAISFVYFKLYFDLKFEVKNNHFISEDPTLLVKICNELQADLTKIVTNFQNNSEEDALATDFRKFYIRSMHLASRVVDQYDFDVEELKKRVEGHLEKIFNITVRAIKDAEG